MKVSFAVILSLACLAQVRVFSYPADKSTDKVGVVPLEKERPITLEDIERETAYGGDQGIVDTGFFGYGNPFGGFLESFETMLNRMRQHMAAVLGSLGPTGNATEIDIIEPFPALPFPNIDLDKGNTTSVTKIIDGHKVVINETEYKDETANGGAYFKVRIIDVKPDSSEIDSTTEKDAEDVSSDNRDRESMENSSENEISKNKEIEIPSASQHIETFDEVDARPIRRRQYGDYSYNYWDDLEPIYPIESNDIDVPRLPIDLSHDTYINEILAKAGAPTNPDAEVFDVNSPEFRPFERMTTR